MRREFTRLLLQWNSEFNQRKMPWKGEKDPYKIWLSEIILQQTRVEQGWAYYNKFIATFPTIFDLAKAAPDKVYKMWEGLGYYTRCKNLMVTASTIVEKYQGVFPKNYEAILALKGIGPYTAAAIVSFAFDQPYAVLDGNVYRILARYFGIQTPIDSTEGKHLFFQLANEVLDKKTPAQFNQAMMDLGAIVCKPRQPLCIECSLQIHCTAFKKNLTDQLPIKQKTIIKKDRWFSYFILQTEQGIFIHKRTKKDIWENLFEFYLVETDAAKKWNIASIQTELNKFPESLTFTAKIEPYISTQTLTHQRIHCQFILVNIKTKILSNKENWIGLDALKKLSFPKSIRDYLGFKKWV